MHSQWDSLFLFLPFSRFFILYFTFIFPLGGQMTSLLVTVFFIRINWWSFCIQCQINKRFSNSLYTLFIRYHTLDILFIPDSYILLYAIHHRPKVSYNLHSFPPINLWSRKKYWLANMQFLAVVLIK